MAQCIRKIGLIVRQVDEFFVYLDNRNISTIH